MNWFLIFFTSYESLHPRSFETWQLIGVLVLLRVVANGLSQFIALRADLSWAATECLQHSQLPWFSLGGSPLVSFLHDCAHLLVHLRKLNFLLSPQCTGLLFLLLQRGTQLLVELPFIDQIGLERVLHIFQANCYFILIILKFVQLDKGSPFILQLIDYFSSLLHGSG